MKRLFLIIFVAVAALTSVAQDNTMFPYPTPPENVPYGMARANYIVVHFWDRCPWKQAYSSEARMLSTLRDFAQFLPHASADTVYLSIDKLIKQSSKHPDDLAALLRLAEATFHSDSATLYSDEVYLPFVRAGATAKKFKPELKQKYAAELKVLESSSEGQTIPPLNVTRRDGSTFALNDTTPGVQTYVLIFERPGSALNRLERTRFASNVAVETLMEAGLLKPILVCTEVPDDAWWKSTEMLSPEWSAGYLPQAEEYFDLAANPAVYVVNNAMVIDRKLMPLGLLTANCEQLISSLK